MLDFEDFKERYQKVPVEEYPNNVMEAVPEPMVSVHVSTYQHADFIHDCLDGVLMQETDFPFEIIIGEDESDDGTREICKEYAEQYPEQIRLFLHRRENNIEINGRPTGRFQFTYSQFVARGKYIAICEGDDYWTDPEKLQKQVEFLETNGEYVVSFHGRIKIDRYGNVEQKNNTNEKEKYKKKDVVKAINIPTMSMCYRNILDKYPREYFEAYCGDRFVTSLLGWHGRAKYQKEISPGAHRLHENSSFESESSIRQIIHSASTRDKMAEYYGRIKQDWLYKEFKNQKLKKKEEIAKITFRKEGVIPAFLNIVKILTSYINEKRYERVYGLIFRSTKHLARKLKIVD